jgi:hypothetical protein
MQTAPDPSFVFDRALVRKRRARAAARFADFAFLKDAIAADVCDRLEPINREFPVVLELCAQGGRLAQELARRCAMLAALPWRPMRSTYLSRRRASISSWRRAACIG